MKDNLSEGQHHGIEEIILKVGDIGEERRSGRDARTVWARKRKVSGGNGGGGPHQRMSCRTELIGVLLVSALGKHKPEGRAGGIHYRMGNEESKSV